MALAMFPEPMMLMLLMRFPSWLRIEKVDYSTICSN